jgi:oleandomycin transport system permease protein
LQFLLPGILAQTISTGAISIGVNLNTDLSKGIFDRFRSLPIPRSAPLIGAVLGDVVRYVWPPEPGRGRGGAGCGGCQALAAM